MARIPLWILELGNHKFRQQRYNSRFALPVHDENGEVERYNIFQASMIIRHAEDGKVYLYDILDIKKKRATRLDPKIVHDTKPISFILIIKGFPTFANKKPRKFRTLEVKGTIQQDKLTNRSKTKKNLL